MSNAYKCDRYQLTYPYEGTKIYRSKSLAKVAKRCYIEFKELNDINEGIFSITNIDTNTEYNFKVAKNKMYKINKNNHNNIEQKGGYPDNYHMSFSNIINSSPRASKIINHVNTNMNINTNANANIDENTSEGVYVSRGGNGPKNLIPYVLEQLNKFNPEYDNNITKLIEKKINPISEDLTEVTNRLNSLKSSVDDHHLLNHSPQKDNNTQIDIPNQKNIKNGILSHKYNQKNNIDPKDLHDENTQDDPEDSIEDSDDRVSKYKDTDCEDLKQIENSRNWREIYDAANECRNKLEDIEKNKDDTKECIII
jgi:hypothetical protein